MSINQYRPLFNFSVGNFLEQSFSFFLSFPLSLSSLSPTIYLNGNKIGEMYILTVYLPQIIFESIEKFNSIHDIFEFTLR